MIRTAVRRAHKKLGRRGTALLLLGLAQVSLGLGYALDPDPGPAGLGLLTRHASIQCWSALWIGCGTFAFGSAWVRTGRDWLGFFAALIPPLVWCSAFLWGSVFGSYPRGFAFAAWYAIGHVGLTLWAASVPEYSIPRLSRKEQL